MINVTPYYDICTLKELHDEFDDEQMKDLYFVSIDYMNSRLGAAAVDGLEGMTIKAIKNRLHSDNYTLVMIKKERGKSNDV